MLELAPGLSLPDSYVTSTGALLAVRGAGKSNTGAVMAEEMHRQQLPFVVVDPVSAWWGLRSSADGKGEGLPIPIFGGSHGDIPLEPGAGELVADLIVDQRLSCILDLKLFDSEAGKRRFLLAFAQRLLKRNADPLHLFLEEADDYLPQKPGKAQLEVLGAFENIVRRGRGAGLGITMITQRSAVLNKNVLTQTETLIAMRNTAPQDIAAVEAWVKYHAVGTELLASLAGLDDGEAWVWSPHFLKLKEPKRVKIRRRATFDSGATPRNVKTGSKRKVATLTDIDLAAIQSRMAATIEKADAENPALLRAQIARLKSELHSTEQTHKRAYDHMRREYEQSQRRVHGKMEIKRSDIRRVEVLAERFDKLLKELQAAAELLTPAVASLHVVAHPAPAAAPVDLPLAAEPPRMFPRMAASVRVAEPKIHAADREPPKGRGGSPSADGTVTPSQQKLLDALAWLEQSVRITTPDRRQVALIAERSASSSTFEREMAALNKLGLVAYPGPNRLQLTHAGAALAQVPGRAPTLEELHARLYARLPPGQGALLKVLIKAYPKALDRETAGQHADPPQSVRSSTFERNIAALRGLGLIDYPGQGLLQATEVLFLEG